MIFYGSKSANIKNDRVSNIECQNCGNNVSMNYNIFQRYVHIYWIPLFPVQKITILECNSCKATFDLNDLTSINKQKIERSNGKTPTPFWMFSGTFIIAVIVIAIFINTLKTDSDSKIFIQDPKIGDVYFVKESNGFYTTMKVHEISKDTLIVYLNDMEIDKKTQIDKINLHNNYNTTDKLSRKQIEKLFEEGHIYEVLRY
jgi:hypothetical protein